MTHQRRITNRRRIQRDLLTGNNVLVDSVLRGWEPDAPQSPAGMRPARIKGLGIGSYLWTFFHLALRTQVPAAESASTHR